MTAPNGSPSSPPQHVLSATYKSGSGNEPFSFSQTFPATQAANIERRTAYLASLRAAVVDTQEKINKELTARMEEDKEREAAHGSNKPAEVDEAKEEENYGEEVVEEEE